MKKIKEPAKAIPYYPKDKPTADGKAYDKLAKQWGKIYGIPSL